MKKSKKRSLKKGASKRKGSQFERVVAKLLDKYWKVPEHTFWRTPLSGGWHEAGDIASRDRSVWFPFIIECKSYKSFDLVQHLSRPDTIKLFKWWTQVKRDSEKAKQQGRPLNTCIPLLIIKINNVPVLCAFNYTQLPAVNFKNQPFFELVVSGDNICLCTIESFMQLYNRELLEEKLLNATD